MVNKKNIIIIIAAILTAVIIAHFGFHKQIWEVIKTDDIKNEVVKKEVDNGRYCFLKNSEGKKRIIIVAKKDNNYSVSGGDVIFRNEKLVESFIFTGREESNFWYVFDDKEKKHHERVYKILTDSVVEGEIKKDNIEKVKVRKDTYYRVKNIKKVIFNEKYSIPKINCGSLVE